MKLAASKIVVASASDAGYALPLGVMLYSVASHLPRGVELEACVLDDGLSGEDRGRVERSVPSNTRIRWRKRSVELRGLPLWGRMPATTYQKLLIDQWADCDCGRVVWLDCDVLALRDITPLWMSELGDHAVGAVADQRIPLVSSRFGVSGWKELGFEKSAPYFNAGVLVVDLDRWRAQGVGRRALEYLEARGDRVYFWDQEALNAALGGGWTKLAAKWNRHPSVDAMLNPGAGPSESPDDGILHFSGGMKPWKSRGPGYALYSRFLDRTAWADARPSRRWHDGLRNWYLTSGLRRLLYPTEQLAVMAERAFTRRDM